MIRQARVQLRAALFVVAVLLAPVASAAGWSVAQQAAGAPLTAAESARADAAIADAQARLPPNWRDAPGLDVVIDWREDLPDAVHGRTFGAHLRLQRALLTDDAAAQPLQAALLHEFAHRYDRSTHGSLSRDPRLLDLAGWPQRPLRFGLRVRDNAMRDRSPDAYELASPAEFVAVNLEHFLLDAEYACRRPALHAYFATHFDWAPPQADCTQDLPFVEAEPGADVAPLLALDPARVYAVDYLLAEGNARPMSRWGHSMLRLVICAPGRAPGPDCRLDLAHHRALSFRAFVDDVQISSLRGLTGRYPSRLFVLPLDQVIDEYTRIELRGLQSIPLQLSPDEIASLLTQAANLHWSYDGRYYFVGNNCAVETWKLLKTGVPRLADARLRSITPTGLLRKLVRSGDADQSVLDREDAVRAGYYFPSADAEYQALLDIARAVQPLPVARVDDWLKLPPDARAPWLADAQLRDGAALLVLEHAARRREELRLRDVLKRQLLDPRHAADAAPAIATLRALLAAGNSLSRPAQLLGTGYGLPQPAELAVLQDDVETRAQGLRGLRGQLENEARAALAPEAQARISALDRNVDALGARLRALHREAGGLQLD
ncbi:DUF4105 domain-containing protein [Luteimonas sp. A1P009]|uniref:DUF4105 domain-containing protein n=1 Tax=Luteimonas fraxinea TaxID=2901869 RepID=A0ABS8UDP1_9GAMM|nr:DUF4105 domain-containing protein [Luteimonas fraxinea]MCD9096829.1 DUF4105 domain-containing protein [Luteimonas fraxinea]MCD9126856.1 DUF4105 domain-containing protein [Luteimonas fraxinea]